MRLRTRYAIVLVGILLVLGTIVVGTGQFFQQQTEQDEQDDVDETAQLAADQVNTEIERQLTPLSLRASDPPSNLSRDSSAYLQETVNEGGFRTALYLGSNGTIQDIYGLEDPAARTDFIGTDDSGESYFETTMGETEYIGDATLEEDGQVTVIMSARIIDEEGERAGVLAGVRSLYDPQDDRVVDETTGPGVVAHQQFDSLRPLNTSEQNARVVYSSEDGDEVILQGSEDHFDESITSRALVEESGLVIEVERDRGVLVDQLQILQYLQFGSLFIVLISMAGLGLYEYRTNLRQTGRLLNGFDELTEGNFDHSLELSAAKEWEQIGDGFNAMADGLREREAELKEREREIREREQRLSVLNRVLRHNLQNDMTVIQGYAEVIPYADSEEKLEQASEMILEKSRGLVNHGKKARQLETVMENAADGPVFVDIAQKTLASVQSFEKDHPDFAIHTSIPDAVYVEAVSGIGYGIESLIENAFEHNDSDDPEVWVTIEDGAKEVTVEIRDNGPGIPEHEHEVLTQDEESSLEHGSGIGLWLAYWAAIKSDGDISFGDPDVDGGVVRLTLPAGEEPEETFDYSLD